jgi:riboflavin synthase
VFTGLIEELGRVRRIERQGTFQRLEIKAERVRQGLRLGDSVNVDGVCQTVVGLDGGGFVVESVEETLSRTTLGQFRPGRLVNLERALRLGDPVGGHWVLGHVDGVGRIAGVESRPKERRFHIVPPPELEPYLAFKGSIALDGISLTLAEVHEGGFTVAVIPHTFDNTTLSQRRGGDLVNLEADVIARYVERLLKAGRSAGEGLSFERLRQMGY